MHTVRIILALAALATALLSCGGNNNPSGPTPLPRNVIVHEDFEGNADTVLSRYMPLVIWQGFMSVTNKYSHSGTQSITTDSNNTGLKEFIGSYLSDSIAGIEFYLYATAPQGINFITTMAQAGSSLNGLSMMLGMGIDKSDSFCLYYQQPYPDSLIQKNVAPLVCNKWNKCNVEYNFNNDTLTCFLNDAVVYSDSAMNPMQFSHFAVFRDSVGAPGPKNYYIDDVTIYKR